MQPMVPWKKAAYFASSGGLALMAAVTFVAAAHPNTAMTQMVIAATGLGMAAAAYHAGTAPARHRQAMADQLAKEEAEKPAKYDGPTLGQRLDEIIAILARIERGELPDDVGDSMFAGEMKHAGKAHAEKAISVMRQVCSYPVSDDGQERSADDKRRQLTEFRQARGRIICDLARRRLTADLGSPNPWQMTGADHVAVSDSSAQVDEDPHDGSMGA